METARIGPGQEAATLAAPASELPTVVGHTGGTNAAVVSSPVTHTGAVGLPAAFASAGVTAASTKLPAAFAAVGNRGVPLPAPSAQGLLATQNAGGLLTSHVLGGAGAPVGGGPTVAQAGLAAYAHISEGAAMYAQHLEYSRYIAALQMQHAAVGPLGSTAVPPLSAGMIPATRVGAWMGLKNHDPDRRYQGIVCRWDEQAGFGFINDLESHRVYGRDVFLHAAQIDREADNYKRRRKIDIANGDRVMFMVEMDRGKPRARDVEIIDKCGKRDEPDAAEPDAKKRRD